VIAMLAIGQGAQDSNHRDDQRIGTNLLCLFGQPANNVRNVAS